MTPNERKALETSFLSNVKDHELEQLVQVWKTLGQYIEGIVFLVNDRCDDTSVDEIFGALSLDIAKRIAQEEQDRNGYAYTLYDEDSDSDTWGNTGSYTQDVEGN